MATTHGNDAAIVVGVIFPAKKIDHLRDVLDETRDGVRFVLIDLYDASITSAESITHKYGALDAVLHKLAHEMVFAELGDADAAQRLALVQEYVQQHPRVKVIDPIASVQLLTNRRAACEMLVQLSQSKQQPAQTAQSAPVAFGVPKFHVIRTREQFGALCSAVDTGDVSLPLICKSVEACATSRSHLMSVITQRADLAFVDYPTLYQEFINHSGRLFKGYVLGDHVDVAERPSLPNLRAGAAQVHFDTQTPYPTAADFHPSSSESNKDASEGGIATTTNTSNTTTAAAPSTSRSQDEIFAAVRAIGERIRNALGLSLFGFDVIVADATQELVVIDVNYFPSYKELDDFSGALRQHIKRQCARTD